MASLSLYRVTKLYGRKEAAVRDVSFEVADGEFVSLVGPSGCGKSTTLNLIAGLDTPTSGTIRIDGVVVNDRAPGERDIAMVFQGYALYPHLDVRRNLAFPLDVAGLPRGEIERRVADTAALLGLTELLARRPKELSGGQRQRVALGRALVRRPKVFLFDEPLSNLDAELRLQMRAELKRLHARLGATFVYVTHDQSEAMTLSSRVVVLRRGELQQIAPPREIYEHPANAFVAGFFGTPRINLVRPRTLGLPPEAGVLVGVRAEHLVLVPESPDLPRAVVDLVEPMGSESWVTVRVDGESLVVRVAPDREPAPGSVVGLRRDAHPVLRFDEATGRRLSDEPVSH